MVKIDATDEAIINAQPLAVYRAFLDEVSGVTHFWMPKLAFKLKGDLPVDQVGAVFDIIANPEKRLKAKFSCRVRSIDAAKRVDLDIFAGDCIGNGLWTFQEIGDKTKVQIRFNVKSNNPLMSLVSPFVDIAKSHSESIQYGFKECDKFLCKKNGTE